MPRTPLIITCEHGGNEVPLEYAPLFSPHHALLGTHRGYDAGAAELAEFLATGMDCDCVISRTTRLLVDLNRSPHHRRLFSEVTRGLPPGTRKEILERHYRPYRNRVWERIDQLVRRSGRVVHVSVHSFVPVLGGKFRNADIGLLYDPGRTVEKGLSVRWRGALEALHPGLRIRFNYPYRGVADGLVTALRRSAGLRYLGLELEVNQQGPLGPRETWLNRMEVLRQGLRNAL